jgi:hypothetical protein
LRATGRRGGSHPLARLGLVFLSGAFLAAAFAPTAAAQTTPTDTGEAAEATLTVTVEGEGEVFSSPQGIACPATCEATFQVGETVTLTASEGIGEFRGWSGACAEAAGTECTLAVAGNVTAGAAFTSPQPPPPPPPEPPGPGPEPPGPPPPPGQLLARIDDILAALPLANIAFNVPKALEVGQRTVIELRMSGRRPIRQLKQEITALGEREGARIRVSDQVEARLTGLGFEIRPLTPERQAVSGEGVTEWGWAISPTESGTLTLHLTVSAVIDVRGAQSTHTAVGDAPRAARGLVLAEARAGELGRERRERRRREREGSAPEKEEGAEPQEAGPAVVGSALWP